MKIADLTFPDHVHIVPADTRPALAGLLAEHIQTALDAEYQKRGIASLVVSGGSTPRPLFEQLSNADIHWSRVSITLADERWVAPNHSSSNERMVRQHLLQGRATAARFIPLWQSDSTPEAAVTTCQSRLDSLAGPVSVIVLGMGNDGHTASLFPCSNELLHAQNSEQDCAVVHPTTAPNPRMTLTPKRLLNSQHRVLHLNGIDKLATLAQALKTNDPTRMPVCQFLQQPLTIYWAP